jgi:hypothetical protein
MVKGDTVSDGGLTMFWNVAVNLLSTKLTSSSVVLSIGLNSQPGRTIQFSFKFYCNLDESNVMIEPVSSINRPDP